MSAIYTDLNLSLRTVGEGVSGRKYSLRFGFQEVVEWQKVHLRVAFVSFEAEVYSHLHRLETRKPKAV